MERIAAGRVGIDRNRINPIKPGIQTGQPNAQRNMAAGTVVDIHRTAGIAGIDSGTVVTAKAAVDKTVPIPLNNRLVRLRFSDIDTDRSGFAV